MSSISLVRWKWVGRSRLHKKKAPNGQKDEGLAGDAAKPEAFAFSEAGNVITSTLRLRRVEGSKELGVFFLSRLQN